MAITRTPMVDDDGSGNTGTIINNAWKTELYGQIDALIGPPVAFTVTDASGAGLTFSGPSSYVRNGNLVSISINITFPVTASGVTARLGGLPYFASNASGLYTTYGIGRIYHIQGNSNSIIVFHMTTGAAITNADLSGQTVAICGTYQIP